MHKLARALMAMLAALGLGRPAERGAESQPPPVRVVARVDEPGEQPHTPEREAGGPVRISPLSGFVSRVAEWAPGFLRRRTVRPPLVRRGRIFGPPPGPGTDNDAPNDAT